MSRKAAILAQERGLDTELVHGIFQRVIGLTRAALKAAGEVEPES